MTELGEIITQKIRDKGLISFRDFMEMALYYPGLGYYTSATGKIGANGDYYTTPCLTPAYGATIGRQLEEMWRRLGSQAFTIVEYGAGNGALCYDILDYLKHNRKCYDRLHYCIIEKSPVMRNREMAHLSEGISSGHENISWYDSIRDIPEITGCILSNELIDNFPVHQVVMEDELMEIFVGYNDGFFEELQPASAALKAYMAELHVALPKGFRTEINLDAVQWISEIAANLKKGYVLTIDYGYNSFQLYAECRRNGTLTCYNKHHIIEQPYAAIGAQDITAHVNFSALCHWGVKNNLDCCGYTNQADFLLALGLTDHLKKITGQDSENFANYRKEAFLKHKLLIDMGSKFKVLIQQKGVPIQKLLGLKLSNSSLAN
jgi:SAM-dependent MidA family methyltransferase